MLGRRWRGEPLCRSYSRRGRGHQHTRDHCRQLFDRAALGGGRATTRRAAARARVQSEPSASPAIANVSDVVADEIRTWQNRPVDEVYPILYVDTIHIKVRDGGPDGSTSTRGHRPVIVRRYGPMSQRRHFNTARNVNHPLLGTTSTASTFRLTAPTWPRTIGT
ncbi:hypothetical protein EWH70_26380 [Amycolatopsis suaedae]|uniref:Mutator family transposase n=1 Tax=Amycolatopsis suaedae TaxID=2510978 RepID=A0A4Q7J295_9PSEU|nr:hypothetical protein EWH70_26380 [Amycolatopsis suaedae]